MPRHPIAILGKILVRISLGQSSYQVSAGGSPCDRSSSAAAQWIGLQVTVTGEQLLNSDFKPRILSLTEVKEHLRCYVVT